MATPSRRRRKKAGPRARVVALVTAFNEAPRVAATVTALLDLEDLGSVVVVDDGSTDGTASEAAGAGARVLAAPRNLGKGRAMDAALDRISPGDVYLLVDADLGASASGVGPILEPVLARTADLATAVLPDPPTGGFGLVKRTAARMIGRLSGLRVAEPLSGQRAVTRECLWACRPLAPGFGVEAAMTADAARLGFTVIEVPVRLEHRFTRRNLAGFMHRGRQGRDVLRALLPRRLGFR